MSIQTALLDYERTLNGLGQPDDRLTGHQVLTIILARDALHNVLQSHSSVSSQVLLQLHSLDQKLKQQAHRLTRVLDFEALRASRSRSGEEWWWHLDTVNHPRWDNYDWVFKATSVAVWTVSLGLLIDISTRFFAGGPGFAGASAVIFSSLLTLLKARSDLTDVGTQGFETLLAKVGIPRQWREETKLGSTIALLGFLLGFWFLLPTISNWYNQRAVANHDNGKLGSAEQNYQRAIALNPDNANAHYNLGTLYEDIQEFDKAKTEYLIAIQDDVPEAHNNLGRLYIQQVGQNKERDYAKAVEFLERGLLLLKEQESTPGIRYSLFKNLGWARLGQERYEEAERTLQAAIGILNRYDDAAVENPGSAHCLLAQVFDHPKEQPRALEYWLKCCQLGSRQDSDEDIWLYKAQQRLQKAGQSCKQP